MKGQGGCSNPCKNIPWQAKRAWGSGLQPSVAKMICIQRDAPWSSSLLWAVTLSYYHTTSFLSFFFCHGFYFSSVVYFKFSSPVEKPYPTYVLQIIGPTFPSKYFDNNHLFSVQWEGLQPCGIFLHSLKSSLLSGEESVSDVNVVLRVFKVFWSCLLSPQHGDKLRV